MGVGVVVAVGRRREEEWGAAFSRAVVAALVFGFVVVSAVAVAAPAASGAQTRAPRRTARFLVLLARR
jgi:hypothetical protein